MCIIKIKAMHILLKTRIILLANDGNQVGKNQSHYRPEVRRGFREVKVPRLRDDGPGCW